MADIKFVNWPKNGLPDAHIVVKICKNGDDLVDQWQKTEHIAKVVETLNIPAIVCTDDVDVSFSSSN